MTTRIVSIERVIIVIPNQIPNGDYKGVWGGYEVTFSAHGYHYRAVTEIGIRTPSAPCTVTVENGNITVEVK